MPDCCDTGPEPLQFPRGPGGGDHRTANGLRPGGLIRARPWAARHDQPGSTPRPLLQRGPLPYLFALKNDETEPLSTYALHHIIRARTRLTATSVSPLAAV